MPTTPTYSLRYLALTDAPNLASATQNLATDVEAQLVRLDTARMGCSLRRVAAQTLPDAAVTAVSWDTEDVDTDGLFPGSGTTITTPANGAGVWAISASILAVAPPTVLGFLSLNVAGLDFRAAFADNVASVSIIVPLNAAAPIVVNVYRDAASGSTMTANIYAYRVAA